MKVLKEEQRVLSSRAKEWVASFPDPTVMTASVRTLCKSSKSPYPLSILSFACRGRGWRGGRTSSWSAVVYEVWRWWKWES